MGTDNEILDQIGEPGEMKFNRRQYLEADVKVDGEAKFNWDLRTLGDIGKELNFCYFDEETFESTKRYLDKPTEQVIITLFRGEGVDLCLSLTKEGGLNIEYRQYPPPEPQKGESKGFYDISSKGAIEATDKFRQLTPVALEMLFTLNGNPITEGQISTHHYNSYVGMIEQLQQLKDAGQETVKLSPTGDWIVVDSDTIRKETKSDTGREGLDAIFGQDVAVRKFRRIIEAMKDPRYKELEAMPNLGCLLYGPPGTGKTSIGRAVAAELGARLFMLDSREVQTSYIGAAGKAITDRLTSVLDYIKEQPSLKAVLLIKPVSKLTLSQ